MKFEKSNNQEKRKNDEFAMKKCIQNNNFKENPANSNERNLQLYAWVKTLLSVHNVIPNIVKMIDGIVAKRATNALHGSLIFGDHKNGTFNQIEELLDFEDRKLSLLNLYAMIEEMTKCLPEKYKRFVELKFYKHKKMDYIAEELDIDERTAFRWSNSVLNKLTEFCKKNNWTVFFIKSQTSTEHWLQEHYEKHYESIKKRYHQSV